MYNNVARLKQRALEKAKTRTLGRVGLCKPSWFVWFVTGVESLLPDATGHMYSN
jgi:hypothetical protein